MEMWKAPLNDMANSLVFLISEKMQEVENSFSPDKTNLISLCNLRLAEVNNFKFAIPNAQYHPNTESEYKKKFEEIKKRIEEITVPKF